MRSPTRLTSVLLFCLAGLFVSAPRGSSQAERPIKVCGNDFLPPKKCGHDIARLHQLIHADGIEVTGEPVAMTTDRLARRKLDTAADYIQAGSWPEVVQLLQTVLDAREDVWFETSVTEADGKTHVRLKSARAEAERLLASLPAGGRDYYQIHCGGLAGDRLREARLRNDPHLLAEVARRYLCTRAGAEALALLGAVHLDRGRPDLAADSYHRLLHRDKNDRLPPLTLFQAAVAFRQAGGRNYEEVAWQRLAAEAPNGLRLGKEQVPLARLRQELDRRPAGPNRPGDWPVFRGNPARSNEGDGGIPYLEARWQTDTCPRPETRRVVEQAARYQEHFQETVLPAFFPVTAGNKVVYRSYAAVHAVDVMTGRELWRSSLPLSYDGVMSTAGMKVQMEQWMRMYGAGLGNLGGQLGIAGGGGFGNIGRGFTGVPPAGAGSPSGNTWAGTLLFGNCVQGTLSTDRRRVYAVEDLPLPPPPEMIQETLAGNPRHFGPLRDALYHNRLRAIDLETGKLTWEVGGRGKGELDDAYFLGPPLPLGGRLYVLADKDNDLRLVCLDPERGRLLWSQSLANYRDRLLLDARRRIQAAPLSYGDGVLVCTTGAGAVIGFELLTRSLVWAHSYRGKTDPDNPGARGLVPPAPLVGWPASAPIVHGGKVVLAPPDDDSVRCLGLRDGTPLWKTQRLADDLYLAAVHNDRVLLVGKERCRALSLTDGKEVWQLETGAPSGQGVAAGKLYFLPLKRGAVCAIDLEQGTIAAAAESRGVGVLGNLVFHEGEVISQSLTQVVAYPQLKAKLTQVNERLARDPRDPVGLTERGALRLDKGDLPAATADLRAALAHRPPADVLPRTRGKLHETLTQWLQRDFAAAEKHLDEYLELCRAPAPGDETERRLATYHAVVARGREKQGRLPEALREYRRLYDLARADQPLAAPEDATVKARPDVWVQGRVATLLAKAAPDQRRLVEEQIAAEWKALRAKDDLAALERFVALYGSACDAGREARLELAERLVADRERGRFLEAELHLLHLRDAADPARAARALEALARLAARKGLMDETMRHYRALARDFGRVEVRDGKTGAALVDELADDKRFLAHFHAAAPAWTPGRLKASEEAGDLPLKQTHLYFEPDGPSPAVLQRYRLVLDLVGSRLKLLERATGAEVWSHRLSLGTFANPLRELAQHYQRVPCRTVGHLAVIHLGFMICGVDLIERRLLWQRPLYDPIIPSEQTTINFNPESGWELVEFGRATPSARLELAGPSVICLLTARGLTGLGPLTGEVLWARTDQVSGSDLHGDADHVYVLRSSANDTRAVRARDGTLVELPRLPDSSIIHQGVQGDRVLVSLGQEQLRLQRARTGEAVWVKEFPAGSRVVVSADPAVTGVLEPGGAFTVLEALTGKVLLRAKVEGKHLENLQAVHLLHDQAQFYLALNGPPDPNAQITSPSAANFLGLRPCVPVNGMLYAFDAASGAVRWRNRVLNQLVVLDHFEDVPILICTTWLVRQTPNGGLPCPATRTYDKKTGKLLYDKSLTTLNRNPDQVQVQPQFSALLVDPVAGTIDLVGARVKVRHHSPPGE